LWVHDDGRYLQLPDGSGRSGNAFDDYPGLSDDFATSRIVLWEQGDRRAIWVPMFRTIDGRTLWVGRPVDDQPLQTFRTEIVIRVLAIVLALVAFQFLVARWITRRAERIGKDLTVGVQKTLESDQPVVFDWTGSPELRQLAEDLTRLSRTHASQTRNLRAHARELEASNRYKSQFLANVSHELRTPLNSILLLSKLLAAKTGDMSAESGQQAEVIHKAAGDLKALIDNILDLSRIESGRLELQVEKVDIAELLGDLKLLLEPQFDAKGIGFAVEIDADAPTHVQTDADKVGQILKNFLGNAVKFTERGGVTLRAAAAAPPYAVALAVRDTGIGIPAAKQDVVFEAFQQADGSTSRRYGGTGLGLTISRELAHMLCGEITLTSKVGEGAEFTLLLPPQCGESGQPHGAAPFSRLPEPETLEEPAPARLAGRHLLLMEPDVRLQLKLSSVMRDWGIRIHLADDLDEALETLVDLERVDFLMIDALMPDNSACDTIRQMREKLGTGTAVISLVRTDRDPVDESCLTQGSDDVLHIPCEAGAMADVLLRHVTDDTG
jgi:signal transduction histidine kinase/CheY-like chemotaxis protein